jgi:O-antigen/teichoic acid export membrane protein
MLSAGTMGTYVVALSLSRVLGIFQTSVVAVLFPKAIGRTPAEIVELTGKAARVSTLCATMIGILILILGRMALVLLYGHSYSAATPVLRVLIVEVVLGGLAMVLAQAAMALGRPGVVTTLQTLGLALTVPLMFLLVPRWGIMGAAFALLLSTCSRLLFMVLSFPRLLGIECPRLWIDASDFRVIASYAAQGLRVFRSNRRDDLARVHL